MLVILVSGSSQLMADDTSQQLLDPTLTASGRSITQPQNGPEGTWDIPVPLINPLGSQSLYTGGTRYLESGADGFIDIRYIDNATEYQKRLHGDVWNLRVNDATGLAVQFMQGYAKEIGGTIFSSVYADSLIFTLKKTDAVWWCDARETTDGYELNIVKQKIFTAGKEYTVTGDSFGNAQGSPVAFVTESTGERFQTLVVKLSSGKITLYAESISTSAESTTYKRYSKTLDSKISHQFILDDVPQGAALFDWKFIPINSEPLPTELTFMIEESYALPKVKYGDDLGSLLVQGAPFGTVYVQPQAHVSVMLRQGSQQDTYGEKQLYEGSLTPGGDTLFWIPPGYWTVVNQAPYMLDGSTKTQLVPVSSGEQTVVSLPDSLKSANARLNSLSDDSELTGGIEIRESKDNTTTASISISVSDPQERDISPTKENTLIYEGGTKVKISEITREVAPASIALVIDSSGSMKKDMSATLKAAGEFLKTLPESSYVKIVDFNSKVKELKGEKVEAAIQALSTIKAGGSTRLFDATIKGVELVKNKPRPAVVVFTDGIDSSIDKNGVGSSQPKSAVIDLIKLSKVPVYTIGFGKRLNQEQKETDGKVEGVPDIQTLLEFAAAAGGQYYPAKDPKALQGVFAAIGSKLGNNFVITYQRPEENRISDTPFISMVVDNSGSMNSEPSEGVDCNYRMEKTIALFHDFMAKLPAKAMLQFTTFQTPPMSTPLIIQQQITSDQKANILKALGEMEAIGGTPIVEALRTAYENILPVPSSKKVIVLLTDGGLEVEAEQTEQYTALLRKIKEKNITVLFVGMGVHSKEKLFADAAKLSGGEYVISENVEDIAARLEVLLSQLKEPIPFVTIPLSVAVSYRAPNGEELTYSVADEVPFAPPAKTGPVLTPDLVKVQTGTQIKRYDAAVGATVTGMGAPGIDNILTNKLEFNTKLGNRVMELSVKQGLFFSKLMGVDGKDRNMQFVALEVELENRTPEKIRYEIPSLFNHFYVGVNGAGLYPASKATWLCQNSISQHGNPEIQVDPGQTRSGVIVFTVPASAGLTQLSLHFYDTNNGHVHLPLTGKMTEQWVELEKLPVTAPVQLSDTFSMEVKAASLKPQIDRYVAGDNSTFRVVEAQFASKVQALLNIDPKARIWLKIITDSGSLMRTISDVTAALPLGFLEPVMLGPASENKVRFAYDLPLMMGKYSSGLFIDLASGNIEIPINSGEVYGAPTAVAKVTGQGVEVVVNQLVAIDNPIPLAMPDGTTSSGFGNTILLDVTFADVPGNEGTSIPLDFFSLVNKKYQAPAGEGATTIAAGRIGLGGAEYSDSEVVLPNSDTQNLVFGVGAGFGVFEGQSRRGVVVFNTPQGDLADWTLQSRYIDSMNVPIVAEKFASPELLGFAKQVDVDTSFEQQLDEAVVAAVAKYTTLAHPVKPVQTQISLTADDGREAVPMPPFSSFGILTLAQITNEQSFLETMQTLRCLPVNRDEGYLQSYSYEAEAVLTQGWGEIGDMANLVKRVLTKLGFTPSVRALALTEAGRNQLLEQTGMDQQVARTIPLGIAYQNEAGVRKTFVVPFMKDISELEGLVYLSSDNLEMYSGAANQSARISVYVRYLPGDTKGTALAASADAGTALGGGDGGTTEQEILLLEKTLPLNILSTDAIDLCFMKRSSPGKPDSYNALLSWPNGLIRGENVLENPARVLGVKVVVDQFGGPEKQLVHYSTLADGDSIVNFFQTIALNLPDLTEDAALTLDAMTQKVHAAATHPDHLSIAKWYGRSILYRFISGQSMFDTRMVNGLKLAMGRIWKPRCIIVSSRLGKDGTLHTSMDLLQPFNEIHHGEEQARQAYNIASGFYLSSLEAEVLPGKNKVGYLDLWAQAPEGAVIDFIPSLEENRDDLLNEMIEKNTYPPQLLEAVKNNDKALFVPTEPTIFEGQKRWAWLEMDPDSYQVISVFDTGHHSAMTEFSINLIPSMDDSVQWMRGIWIGNNVSLWSLCTASLQYGESYQVVLQQAKKSAEEVGNILADFLSKQGIAESKSYGFSMEATPNGSHAFDLNVSMSGLKGSFKQNMLDFNGGYKLAVDTYFNVIAPDPKPRSPGRPPKLPDYK
jgi:VWFA-related protein